jgi:hypothetical protein
MSDHEQFNHDSEHAVPNDFVQQDDIRVMLAVLKELAGRTGHPVVRACLEQAHDDIVHLTSYGEESQGDDELTAA